MLRVALALLALPGLALAGETFPSIDGGAYDMDDWSGQPVLVVNTASQCAFAPQFVGLQDLYDAYREAGLVVLAVPSDDFRQELETEAEVKEYCAMVFGIDMPMTEIEVVTGEGAHPFYARVAEETGFAPTWNFNKILIGPDGDVLGTWGSAVTPQSPAITGAVEAALGM
ncbi:glutathione peroxidase [Wenxinia saemankumensis]|uniref:Glutathione peroxidase n=1 Tax=Wenxinia saemankumensis TaxID=1447782 RepID=A0A1M6CQ05_9RHOB|nr:glutathione peroxidase [Wenxinia saemankumensis]SHI63039.1 glutathione peroxidase [Wenxinia saemankumensis]